MKNQYIIDGERVTILITRKNGQMYKTYISLNDLPLLLNEDCVVFAMPTKYQIRAGIWFYSTKKQVLLHRFILNAPADKKVDHIDHNPLNNCRENLRIVTNAENMQNLSGTRRDSKTGIRGVHRRKHGKWCATVQINGKRHWLGTFDTPEEAEYVVKNFRASHMPFSPDHREIKSPIEFQYLPKKPGNPNLSSGIRNVYWHKHQKKWYVVVGHDNKDYFGGYFDDIDKAIITAENLRRQLWGA